jgi:hypothetical protein
MNPSAREVVIGNAHATRFAHVSGLADTRAPDEDKAPRLTLTVDLPARPEQEIHAAHPAIRRAAR